MGDWNRVVGDKSDGNICGNMDWEVEAKEVKCLLASVKVWDLLSLTRALRSLREGCTRGKLQAIYIDISWIIYM
jgi:hypothetical protein